MLDIHGRSAAAQPNKPFEFLRAQLSPTKDGSIFVTLTGTAVDETEPECFELIDLELVNHQVPTIDAALALVSEHARRSFAAA